MGGVNELAEHFRTVEWNATGEESRDLCADEIEYIVRTAWRPVSEPPTEADGDFYGLVVVEASCGGTDHIHWGIVAQPHPSLDLKRWARVRDVLLMPEVTDGRSE